MCIHILLLSSHIMYLKLMDQVLSNNPRRGLHEAIYSAVITVLKFDKNDDNKLGREETKALIDQLAQEMDVSLRVVAGILVMAPYSYLIEQHFKEVLILLLFQSEKHHHYFLHYLKNISKTSVLAL